MGKLEKLINKLCPNGVEYKHLKDITKSVNIGINPRKFFKLNPEDATGFYVTVRELNGLNGVNQTEKTDLINDEAINIIQARAKIEKGDILFSNTGTVGKMALVNSDIINWGVNEGIYVIKPIDNIISSKFLYYYLDSGLAYADYSKMFTGSTMKHITQKALLSISIPVPPLEVQSEVVCILDNLSNLTTELTSDLTYEFDSRKKQLDFYKNSLFNFNDDIDFIELGDMCDLVTKQTGFDYTKSIKASLLKERKDNTLPYLQTKFFSGRKFEYETDYYIPTDVAKKFPKILLNKKCILFSIVGASIGNVGLFDGENECFLGGAICVAKVSDKYNIEYLYHYLTSHHGQKQIFSKVKGAGQATVTIEDIRKFRIPLPSMEIQNTIVHTLNNLDELVNNIIEVIPTEIEKRQKQYEYYRDKILNFKEVEVNE